MSTTGRAARPPIRRELDGPERRGNANGPQFSLLSLFLLLLVFFIVIGARSAREAGRSQAALKSIDESFQPFTIHPRLREGHDPVASRSGTVFAAERVEGIGDLFATAVAVSKVTVVTPGRLIEVRLPADALFAPGTDRPRIDRQALLDRVVESLRRPREGERIELDALLAIDEGAPAQPPGPVQRAAALARALVADGAPPQSVTVGVERGPAGSARFLFSVRSIDGGAP